MIYLVGWGLLYFAIVISALTRYRGKVLVALTILFIAVIAIFRGNVGTDTATYEHIVASPSGVNQEIVEPGVNGNLAQTEEEWFNAFLALQQSAVLRHEMGEADRDKVKRDYCLQVTASHLSQLFKEIIQDKT
ncbi:MAG: glycosyltransferase [Desulfobacteraceae bacterium]|nr:glycosyltransferase [Desulfobacteraceae bacterium]